MGTVPFFRPAAQLILPGRLIDSWVTLIGLLSVALALCYAAADPAAPWWSLGALLTVSLTFALLAVWRRRPALVYASGLLANVAATVVWVAWWRFDPVRLAEINVVALSAAALAWSLVRPLILNGIPGEEGDGRRVPFVPWAASAGLALLGLLVWSLLVCDLMEIARPSIGRLGGIALAASLLSIVVCFWDRRSRFVLAGLYGWSLTAAGLGLAALALKPDPLCWTAGLALSLFVLAMAMVGKLPLMAMVGKLPVGNALRGVPAAVGDRLRGVPQPAEESSSQFAERHGGRSLQAQPDRFTNVLVPPDPDGAGRVGGADSRLGGDRWSLRFRGASRHLLAGRADGRSPERAGPAGRGDTDARAIGREEP